VSEIEVKLQEVSDENVVPYGTLIDASGKTPSFNSDVFSYWDALNEVDSSGRVSFGMVESYPGPIVAVNLERHSLTSETLVPIDADIVLIVGKKTDGDVADLASVSALRIPQGKAVTLHAGTWHYVPLVRERTGRTMIVFRSGTPNDDLLVDDFKETRDQIIRVVE